MKLYLLISLLPGTVLMLVACQPMRAAPLIAEQDVEFVLAPGGTAAIKDTGLTIRLISILSDGRCPSEIECTESGPVQLSLSAQKDNGTTEDFIMQTFTDYTGRSSPMVFEGIQDRVVHEGYLIRIAGVLPYPGDPSTSLRQNDYRVSFVVTK